jgi:hypothetical protein
MAEWLFLAKWGEILVFYLSELMDFGFFLWTKSRKERTMRCLLKDGSVAVLSFAECEVSGCWKAQMSGISRVIQLTLPCITGHRIPVLGL